MTARVILNPFSNRWNAGKRRGEVEAALKEAGVDFDLVVSPGPGQITPLAEEAARAGFSPIIAAGGDGTIGETVNGLLHACGEGELVPLGLMPLGSANDLASNIHYPTDPRDAARVIAGGLASSMDLCQVTDLSDGQVHYFANNAAAGFEPYVTTLQEKITWIKGMTRYLVAAVQGVLHRPTWSGRIEWEGGEYEGPISLVTVCNGARSGGVFYMAPHADPFDGQLTAVFGYRGTRMGMLTLLPKAMKPGAGSYVESPGMVELHTTWITIHLDSPSPAHVDGEIFSLTARDLEYRVLPGRIKILI